MYEIELKAHVVDLPQTKELLCSFADYKGTVEKFDVYWQQNQQHSSACTEHQTIRLRIRENIRQNAQTYQCEQVVTYKHKTYSNDIEVNDEKEFTISDKNPFEFLIQKLGFEIQTRKHKSTEIWTYGAVLIELSSIEPLGTFIEIEIISELNDTNTIEKHRKTLYNILERCGIPQSAIETRHYTEMLAQYASENRTQE